MELHYKGDKMKKILIVLTILSFLLISARQPSDGSLIGWIVTGYVKTVQDTGGVHNYGRWSVTGYNTGGSISQIVNIPGGYYYSFVVWCKGNPSITFSNVDITITQSCNHADWYPLGFSLPGIFSAGDVTITAQLKAGDYVDMFCFFQGVCPPSLIVNPSFEPMK